MTFRTPTFLAAAVLASLSMAAQAAVPPDSKLTVTETVSQNADLTWHYDFDVTNTDLTGIWFIAFGTGSSEALNPDATSTGTVKLGSGWSSNDAGSVFANGPWYVTFTNDAIASTGAKLAVGKSETYSFDLTSALTQPVSYVYLKAGQGAFTIDSQGFIVNPGATLSELPYSAGTVSAGPVPEPETYALFAAGLTALGMLARRRRAA